jgi:hypothetical protein
MYYDARSAKHKFVYLTLFRVDVDLVKGGAQAVGVQEQAAEEFVLSEVEEVFGGRRNLHNEAFSGL